MGNCPEVHSVIQREVSSYKTAQKWAFLDDFHILAACSRAQKKQKDMKISNLVIGCPKLIKQKAHQTNQSSKPAL